MTSEDLKKKKKVSKKNKRSWRKNTDVADVEEHLEDVRLQERTGGLVAEKSDAELFFVDNAPVDLEVKDEPSESEAQKKKSIGKLRCHALLEPNPDIKAVTSKRQQNKQTYKAAREASGKFSLSLKSSIEQRKKTIEAKKEATKRERNIKATFDIWAENGKIDQTITNTDEHFMKTTKKYRPKVPRKYLQKPSEVKAVELPHPGASYNPTFNDHQDLLSKAHETELRKVKADEKIERALTMKFPEKRTYSPEKIWLQEMSQGLKGQGGKEEEEDNEEEEEEEMVKKEGIDDGEEMEECVSYNPPVRRDNKKTEAQRRKELLQKKKEQKMANTKKVKSKETEIFRLKSIQSEIVREERGHAARAQRRLLTKEAKKDVPKRLGPHKFEEPDLDIKLSDELSGSMRTLKPEGNLLEDRLKSLQKRSIIEPRKKAKARRRYGLKKLTKRRFNKPVE